MTALIAATVAIQPAAAAPTDVTEAEGVLLRGGGVVDLDDIAQLAGAYAARGATSGGGTTSQPVDLQALDAVRVGLGNDIDLLGPQGILTLGVAGQYASATPTGATASSGAVTENGGIGVGTGSDAGPRSTLDLTQLLGVVGADDVLANGELSFGALGSTITSTRGAPVTTTTDYDIADADLTLQSPAVAGLTQSLRTDLSAVSDRLDATIGSGGALNGVANGLTGSLQQAVQPLGLITLNGTQVTATADLDLRPALDRVAATPLTSGAVTVDLGTGRITVDLDELTALNDQGPNTPVLTDATIAAINTALADILERQLPTLLQAAVVEIVNATAITIDVSANAQLRTGVLPPVGIPALQLRVATTLGDVLGTASNPGGRQITASGLVGGAIAPLFTGLVGTTLLPAVAGVLGPVVGGDGIAALGRTLTATTTAVAGVLAPAVALVRQVVDVTVNVQDPEGDFRDPRGSDAGSRSVSALRLAILPDVGPSAATVDLATSTVRATAFVAPTITAPTAGQQFSVPSDSSTRSVTVSGAGEPGAAIALDAGGGRTATATVGADGTWTTTIAGVPVGDQTVTATQTVAGVAAGSATQTFSIVAQRPLVIATPTAGQRFTTAGTTAPVTLTGTATANARIDIELGGGLTADTTADGSGAWSVRVDAVPVGDQTASVTQTVGDTTSGAVTRDFTVVTAAGLTIDTPTEGQDLPLVGDTRDVVLTGAAEPDAQVDVDLGGGRTATSTATSGGTWSATVEDVPAGAYTASVTQTVDGTTSGAVTRDFTVTAAPGVTIDEPADGSTLTVADATSTTTVTVTGTAAPDASVAVDLGGSFAAVTTADEDGEWTATFVGVPVGPRTVTARQTVDGATSDPATSGFEVVAGAPLTIDAPADGATVTVLGPDDTTDLAVSGTAEPGAEVRVSLGGGLTGTTTADDDGDWTVTVPDVPVGRYTVSATQTVGGTTSPAVEQTVTVAAARALTVTAPTQGSTTLVATDDSVIDVPVTGTAQPGAEVRVVLDDGDPVTTTADDDGAWTVTLSDVATGDHTIAVTQTVGGRTSDPVERDFAVAAGDALVIVTPTDGQQVPVTSSGQAAVVVRGTATAGATVTVTVDEGDPVDVVADSAGNWATDPVQLGTGDHTVTAVQTVNGTTGPVETRDFEVLPATAITIDSPAVGSRFVVVDEDATATVPISGTAEPGADVTVTVGDLVLTTTAGDDGTWTVEAEGLAPAGDYTVEATQDVDGATTDALPTSFTVDVATPLAVTSPSTAPITVAGEDVVRDVTVRGTGQPGVAVVATIDDGDPADGQATTVAADGSWSVTFPGVGVGAHPVSVTQTLPGTVSDPATSDPVTRTVTIVAADAVTITSPEDGAVLLVPDADATRDVTVTGTAEPGAPVTVRVGDAEASTTADDEGDWTVTVGGVGVGDQPVTATQTVGGTTASSPEQTVTVRAGAALQLTTPEDGDVLTVADPDGTADVVASGRAEPGAPVTVTLSTGERATVDADEDGAWTHTFADVPVGDHTVRATQVVGGVTSAPVSAGVSVRAGAPLTVTTPAGATSVTVADDRATTDVDFAGTGEPGATVTVDLGDAGSAEATVDEDGAWSTTVEDVPVGSWTASVTQSVNGTTSAPVTRPVSVVAAAELTIRQPGDEPITVADDAATTTVTVAGDAQPGATVTVTVDDRDPVETTAGPDGSWSVDVEDVAVGQHDVSATQTVGGSTSTSPVESTFEVAPAAPVEVTTPADGQQVTVADEDATTTVTVGGTAEPGATVVVDLGGGRDAATTVGDDGTWQVEVPGVPAGSTTVSVTQQVGGTTSQPVIVGIEVVVADPVTIATPADGSTVRVAQEDSLATITANGAAEPGAEVRVTLDDGDPQTVTATDAGTWSVRFARVATGEHTIRATQTVGGSTSAPVASTFTVAPGAALTVTSPTDDQVVTVPAGDPTVDLPVSGTGQPGATVVVVVDEGDPVEVTVGTDGTWGTDVPGIGAGDHTVTVTQEVGGTTSTPVVVGVTVDAADEDAVVITTPTPGSTVRIVGDTTDVRVAGTAAPGAAVSVTVDDGTAVATTADDAGAWAVTVPDVGRGEHTVAATQTVDGRTTAAPEVAFTVVAAAPLQVTSPTDGQVFPTGDDTVTVPVSGTAEPGATVTVDVDGTTVTTTAGGDGSWTVTVPDVPVGDHTVSVTQTVGGATSAPVTSGISVVVAQQDDVVITDPTPGRLIEAAGLDDTASFPVSGTAAAGAAVVVRLSNGQVRSTDAGSDGRWTVTFDGVPAGEWSLQATQTVDGTPSDSQVVPIVVRVADPLAVTSPVPGARQTAGADGTATWRVAGTAEPGATVTVRTDGDGDASVTTAADDGTRTVTVPLAVGPHTFTVTQTVGGATSAAQTVDVVVVAAGTPGTPEPPIGSGNDGSGTDDGIDDGAGNGNGNGSGIGTGNGAGVGTGTGDGAGTGDGSGRGTGRGLAFTGADVAPLAGAAGGLVVLGFLLLGLSRLARGIRRRGRA
ncbi:choice-of-anchor G family protein [Curtobacterium caseinilyticum]|uniref:Ig-like domain-containing protein n=1 Tax=Curtobacterium caseinilyticum TaxID=3055137 RepID=A0ABT7TN26_9MICO|nr:choice-of-anchor G family protein [Curtobacterium caseinilyticum]MDM7890991.1 Ig-like domain-containing protein [Curtobacterium caseinilyticum]